MNYQYYAEELQHIRFELQQCLTRGGCTKTVAEVDLLLLWVCDLQDLVPASYHAEVCHLWNRYWTVLWRLRSECDSLPGGHGPWLHKPYFRHAHHYVCARCGVVSVQPDLDQPSTSAMTSSTAHESSAILEATVAERTQYSQKLASIAAHCHTCICVGSLHATHCLLPAANL